MQTLDNQLPPIAQALGRLRQNRTWPFAPRPLLPGAQPTAHPRPPIAPHDFLRILPDPALTGDLPPATPARLPEPETARTYWFDL